MGSCCCSPHLSTGLLWTPDKAADLFNLLNPIHHSSGWADLHRYKVEPYAIAADVYSEPPHEGRGGWTWYTGAAAWFYRAGLEWILGFQKRGSAKGVCRGVSRISLDGIQLSAEALVPLVDDAREHQVQVVLG